MKLVVEIELQESMADRHHLAWALSQIEAGLENFNDDPVFPIGVREIKSHDFATVGHWEIVNEDNADVRVVRPVGGGFLGSQEPLFVPLPITDDRNKNSAYGAWLGEVEELPQ